METSEKEYSRPVLPSLRVPQSITRSLTVLPLDEQVGLRVEVAGKPKASTNRGCNELADELGNANSEGHKENDVD